MKVFVTGATGFIGSAVVQELLSAGHQVLGLARSDAAAASLTAAGATPHRGSIDDLASLQSGAAASDGVIHLAFIHDFTNLVESCEKDRRAIEALGEVLAGTGKPFVVTVGTMGLEQGRLVTEEDLTDPNGGGIARIESERTTLALASKGVRSSIVRLPPSVHGEGDHGFAPVLINIARAKGVSAYIGDGSNRWPTVHRLDAARVFRLALESAPAGSKLHAVAEEAIPFRDIATVVGRHLNVPVVSKSKDEAADHFSWLAFVIPKDNPTSSALTREQFGWSPVQLGLLQDLDQEYYYKS
ncbi:MAG: hypothetical protein M1834_009340 [Cirrosporium novae-zelandiae]|nr:MAG: hypothetical protein M1834_009340 [Cirrosporium novae-zelandiae]